MKYLIVLLLLASVAMPITLQHDTYQEGNSCSSYSFGQEALAVEYDLTEEGYESFVIDSIEIGIEDNHYPSWFVGFDVAICQAEGLLLYLLAFGDSTYYPERVPPAFHLQQFHISYDEPVSDVIWIIIYPKFNSGSMGILHDSIAQDRSWYRDVYLNWHRFVFGELVIRIIGHDVSALNQSTWGAIKSQF